MSGNIIHTNLRKTDWKSSIPVLRYAIGSTLILAVAAGSGYTLSYLTPVLAVGFLAPNAAPLSLKAGLGFVFLLAIASITGVIFSRMFLGFPMVFIPLLALVMLHLYYTTAMNQLLKTFLLISLLLIPLLSIFSSKLGDVVAISLVLNGIITVFLVWFIYQIFPSTSAVKKAQSKNRSSAISKRQQFEIALRTLIVVLPVVISYFVFQWSGSILVMVFVVLLSMNPEAANFKTGKFMIFANLAGGLAAILAFNLFSIVPEFIFLILITIIMGLYFGRQVFSGKPAAPLFGTAFSTYLLVLGSVTTSTQGDAGEKVWARIIQIGIAVTYVVIAFGLVNHFTRSKNKTAN